MITYMRWRLAVIGLLLWMPLRAHDELNVHDVLIEAKGAYFQPTHNPYKNIFHGSGLFSTEITTKAYKQLYAFIGMNFTTKSGKSTAVCDATRVQMCNVGVGLKYLFPFSHGDVYVGLGLLPTWVQAKTCSPFVIPTITKWGLGGVFKLGLYVDLPRHFFMDFFFDYNFVAVNRDASCNYSFVQINPTFKTPVAVQLTKANVSGCLFGLGVGYRFN